MLAGGARGLYDPADEPAAFGGMQVTGRPACGALYSFTGAAMPLHYNTAGGSPSSPSMPVANANIGGIGCRTWDATTNTWNVSHSALQSYLQEDAIGNNYIGSRWEVQTSPKHGTSPFARRTVFIWDDTGSAISPGTDTDVTNSLTSTGSKRCFYGRESPAGGFLQSTGNVALFLNRNASVGKLLEARQANNTVGDLTVGSSTFVLNSTSDEYVKTKTNVKIDWRSIFKAMEVGSFTWNVSGETDYGLFARALHKQVGHIIPNLVAVGSPDDVKPADDGFVAWRVAKAELVPSLVAALQGVYAQQDAQHDAVLERIAVLEAKISALPKVP